jgi:hypothetical protein
MILFFIYVYETGKEYSPLPVGKKDVLKKQRDAYGLFWMQLML